MKYFNIVFGTLFISMSSDIAEAENNNINRFRYFGTKTLYSVAKELAGAEDKYLENSLDLSDLNESTGYKIIHINGLIRHGTRNPGRKDMNNLLKFLSELETYVAENGVLTSNVFKILHDDRFKWLHKHMFPNATFTDKYLVKRGYEELEDIGKFVKELLNDVNADEFVFISSDTHRTIESATAFQKGLGFSENITAILIEHELMRFYDYCNKYLISVADNETSQYQHNAFKIGLEITKVTTKLQKALKANDSVVDIPISYKALKALYTVAACEVAVYGNSSLLELFEKEDLETLEYAGDLRSFWKRGYGHAINYEQGCYLMNQMFDSILDAANGEISAKRAVFRFGHAETVLPVMSLLGLYKDKEPLNADNFANHTQRLFRTSKIMPFAGNIIFVVVQSMNDSLTSDTEQNVREKVVRKEETEESRDWLNQFKVVLFHNERAVPLPACPNSLMCSLDIVLRYYTHWIDNCDLETMCHVSPHDEL